MEMLAQIAVLAFGLAVIGACLWGLLVPEFIVTFATNLFASGHGIGVAVSVRVVLGACLLVAASASRFPLIFQVVGCLYLVGAVAIPFIGRERVLAMLNWIKGLGAVVFRCWLVLGLAFGGLLVVGANLGN
jgi:hypothetical protein